MLALLMAVDFGIDFEGTLGFRLRKVVAMS